MAEISSTQEQYYLNYLQQKANNEREDTIRQEGYDREDAIRQEGYNRADTAESFTDFIDNISALSTKESRDDFVNSRLEKIEDEDGTVTYKLDGRELTKNKVTRYLSTMYVSDQKLNDTSSENAIKNSDSSMSYEPNGEMSINYYYNQIQQAYDNKGNKIEVWNIDPKNMFENSFHAMDELMKSSSITNGTIIKMDGFINNGSDNLNKDISVYAVYNNGKLYYIKDSQEKWNKTSTDNRICIDKNGNVSRGDKTKG